MKPVGSATTLALLVMLACSTTHSGTDASPTDGGNDTYVAPRTEADVCEAPNVVCAGQCVDLQRAYAHCGQCGRPCAGFEVCVEGACVPGQTCPTTCTSNDQCRACTLEGDRTNWCCQRVAQDGRRFCRNNLTGACPALPAREP